MALPNFIKAQSSGVCLKIRLQPRASQQEIGEVLGNELKIKVTAPPVDSAANQALVEFLAETLGCSRSAVQIVRGHTSRHKTIFITGKTAEEIAKILNR